MVECHNQHVAGRTVVLQGGYTSISSIEGKLAPELQYLKIYFE